MTGHRTGKHLRRLSLRNAHIKTAALTAVQTGYLAAFLDGEGGVQLTRTTRHNRTYSIALHPTVYFTNTHFGALQRMRGWLDCGCVTRRKSRLPRHKDVYHYSVTGTRNVLLLLEALLPHLIVKQPQAFVLIEYCRSRLTHFRSGDRQFSERELALYTELKALNVKGGIFHPNARKSD